MAWILVGSWVFIQLLVVVLYAAIDGRWLDRFTVVDLGRVYLNENGKTERLCSGAGAGGFQGVVQGTGAEPVKSSDRPDSHFQRATAEKDGQGTGSIHGQFGEGVSRELRGGEGEGSTNGSRGGGSYRERLERRANECGLLGPRVK